MPRRLFNWTFWDIKAFLTENGFLHVHTEGSHYYFSGHAGGKPRLVHVPFHGNTALKPRTLKSIIVQSGIPKDEWLHW